MMPARSAPDLQPQPPPPVLKPRADAKHATVYNYLQNKSGPIPSPPTASSVPAARDAGSPPGAAPVRDSASLRSVRYGPGHEKFPSWPAPAAAEVPAASRGPPSGGSTRSKSWTDRTAYPKERPPAYARPHARRHANASVGYAQQKLKTVMERCEKIPPETFESRSEKINERLYLPRVNHDSTEDYMVPERDISTKTHLTQTDLEEYVRSYQDYSGKEAQHHLTESGLQKFIMEYSRTYASDNMYHNKHDDNNILTHMHQKQLSYAQSEGYHSYVSSTDSTSTPFLDRLRRDSEAVVRETPSQGSWDELSDRDISKREGGRDSVVTDSSGSASSSETLKWHGSMSDVSVASSSCTHLANSSSSNSRQLIAHSARVKTPQRHHSESVLYMSGDQEGWKDKEIRNNTTNKLKLFAVNTYTVQEGTNSRQEATINNTANNRLSLSLQSALSVADRISELEKQQKYSFLDPDKRHKIPDPALKAIQKKALLSFYERHHNSSPSNNKNTWRSEPQLAQSQNALSLPQPPPKVKMQLPSRRASSASDYVSGPNSRRSSLASSLESKGSDNGSKIVPKHQHSNSCGSLSTDLLGPVIVGPSISVDDWVPTQKPPARPPKNPHLRTAYPDLFQNQRVPSPDLPPPSPPTVFEDEVAHTDEPLPPPPPECDSDWQQDLSDRLKENNSTAYQTPAPQVQKSSKSRNSPSQKQTISVSLEKGSRYSIIKSKPTEQIQQISSKPYNNQPEQVLDFPSQKGYAERSSTRYPTTQKLVLNGNVALSQNVNNSEQMRSSDIRKQLPVLPGETHRAQRASIAESCVKESPPPLQPRQMRINQSMRARIPAEHRPGAGMRTSPPREVFRDVREAFTSQSKASYLASRRDRNRIVPDSETGSYKRTMSPNGHAIPAEAVPEPTKPNPREAVWPLKSTKEANIIRRSSTSDKHRKDKCDEKKDLEEVTLALPDVLPVNVKRLGPRPTQLSLSPLDNERTSSKLSPQSPNKSPPSSPPKSPSRGSPFSPLRTTSLSSSPSVSSTNNSSPILRHNSSTKTVPNSSPSQTRHSAGTSPQSPKRNSPPHIKPSLSPNSPIKRLSPLRSSPSSTLSLASPLHLSIASPQTCCVDSATITTSTPQYAVGTPLKISTPTRIEQSTSTSPPPSPIKEEYPVVLEGLQMIQRTEVVLRVNTSTSDASSQTEKEELPPTPLPTRKKLQEEIDCEKLSEDFVNHLPTSDRLKDLLVPGPDHKKPTDYVHGLFRVDVTSKPRPANSPFRSRNNTPSNSPPPTLTPQSVKTSAKLNVPASPPIEPISPISGNSVYFTTSEPKAKFLTTYSQDMNQCHVVKDTKDLSQKKDELVSRLDKKLEVLRSEALVVSDESKVNNELGQNVETHLSQLANAAEVAKFKLHVEEIGKITSLLLGLSGRLARAENALMGMPEDHPERRIMESKRDKLSEQLEEAKKLKECIDRRSISVSNILYKYMTAEEYADYDHFINMKAKLIMDTKEISDKIKLGEEQLLALKETLIVTD